MTLIDNENFLDFKVEQYATWNPTFVWTDSNGAAIDLTGYTVSLMWRTFPVASTVLTLSGGSGITITAATGTMAVVATATQTGAIAAGTYQYDILVTSAGGVATRIIQGNIILTGGISRA